MATATRPLTLELAEGGSVSALWLRPPGAFAALALAHGAGVDIDHPSMATLAEGLADRAVATLRYRFPYRERGSRRPDSAVVATATVRAAVAATAARAAGLPLFAGGRSFGGRMTTLAEADAPLPGLCGLVLFAYPLHPAGRPGIQRAEHLARVRRPMLFLQGTRDALAEMALLRPVIAGLGQRASLALFAEADHSFHVPARSGQRDSEVLAEILETAATWMAAKAGAAAGRRRSSPAGSRPAGARRPPGPGA